MGLFYRLRQDRGRDGVLGFALRRQRLGAIGQSRRWPVGGRSACPGRGGRSSSSATRHLRSASSNAATKAIAKRRNGRAHPGEAAVVRRRPYRRGATQSASWSTRRPVRRTFPRLRRHGAGGAGGSRRTRPLRSRRRRRHWIRRLFGRIQRPPLTTVEPDFARAGQLLVETALAAGDERPERRVAVHLVERAACADQRFPYRSTP